MKPVHYFSFLLLLLKTSLYSQNVGIGTTTPINNLSVVGTVDITDSLGIGTTTPAGELHIKSRVTSNGGILDQQQTSLTNGAGSTVNWQSFTAGVTGLLTRVDLQVSSPLIGSSSPGTIKIFLGEGNTGTLLSTTAVTIQDVHNTFQLFTLSSFPAVIAGYKYTIEFSVPSMILSWVQHADNNPYSSGKTNRIDPLDDYLFKTYVASEIVDGLMVADGKATVTNLRLINGAANGFVLKSDASGNANWANVNTLNITEADPKVGTLTSNKIPKWNGSVLSDGVLSDDGTNIGIGTTNPSKKLTVVSPNAIGIAQLSGSTANTSIGIGRAEVEGTLNIAGNSNEFAVGSASGDVVLRTESNSKRLILNSGNGAAALTVSNGNVGIGGTINPAQKLDVNGTTKTTNLQITNGASNGFVLKSDASGNASWVNANTLTVTETDPKVGTLTSNLIPKWNGSILSDGVLFDNGTNIGIGTTTPAGELHVKSTVISNGSNIDQQQTSSTHGAGSTVQWQSFTAGATGLLTRVDLRVSTPINGGLASSGTIKIFLGEGNSGNLLSTTAVTFQGIYNSFQSFTLSSFPAVVAGNKYTIEFSVPFMNVSWVGLDPNNPYPGGRASYGSSDDCVFKTYVASDVADGLVVADGKATVTKLQITNGAANGFVLRSDANGNTNWADANTLTVPETDPKVGTLSSNKIPKWNGTNLTDGLVFDNGSNVGIGTITPTQKLDINGTTKTTNLQITNGASNGFILKSDASGNANWVNANTLTVTETDPKVGTITSNKIPRWNGSILTDGVLFDNGTNIGIGTTAPAGELHVKSVVTSNGSIIDQQQTMETHNTTGSTVNWQSFTAAATGLLTRVDLRVASPIIGSSSSPGTIKIFMGEGNTGTLLSTTSVTFQGVNTNFQPFTLSNYPGVIAGNKYTIEFSVPSWNTTWVGLSQTNPYLGGRTNRSDAAEDYVFRTYVATEVADGLVVVDGKTGIGTSIPAAKLHVASVNSGLRIDVPPTQTALSIGGAGSVQVDAIGVVGGRLLIDDNGNMGVGTPTPTATLDVNGGIRTKYSGTAVFDLVGGAVTTLSLGIPALPADWNIGNTVVLVTNADGVDGVIRQAKLTSSTNIDIKYIQDMNGFVRFNWIVFRL